MSVNRSFLTKSVYFTPHHQENLPIDKNGRKINDDVNLKYPFYFIGCNTFPGDACVPSQIRLLHKYYGNPKILSA